MNLSPQELADQFTRLFAPEVSAPNTNDVAGSMPDRDTLPRPGGADSFASGVRSPRGPETEMALLPDPGTPAVGLIEPHDVDPAPVPRVASLLDRPSLDRDVQVAAPAPQVHPATGLVDKAGFLPVSPTAVARLVDYPAKGYHLDVAVLPGQVVAAAALLDQQGFTIDTVTGVDWIADEQMEVVYDYFHSEAAFRVAVRTRIPRSAPEVPTISEVFPGANWHERETHDFFGIRFLGHPNLTPFLLPEDADYHPLRKDIQA